MLRILFSVLAVMLAAGTPLRAQTTAIRLAQASSGASAWFSAYDGLTVRDWPAAPHGALSLGAGAEPRFDDAGRLFFIRSIDSDYHEVSRTTWVLDPGSIAPRPATSADAVPEWSPAAVTRAGVAASGIKIAIDAGHGGSDPGALGNGLREADITLDTALRLEGLLQLDTADTSGGGTWDVLMTRSADVTVSLAGRTSAANAFGAASFVSIHMNAFSSTTANGSETYCYPGSATGTSGTLRNRLHAGLIAAWNRTDRGVKTANFYVLRNTSMPAALVEGAFISNAADAAVMANATQRQQLALNLLYALQEHHGFARHTPAVQAPTGRLRGFVSDASNAALRIGNAVVALRDGTFTKTGTDGYYEFALPAGPVEFAASAPSFGFGSASANIQLGVDVWRSVQLPLTLDAPQLVAGAISVPARTPVSLIMLGGDPNAPVALLLNFRPATPPVDLSVVGLDTLWPDLNGMLSVGLGSSDGLGRRFTTLSAPTGGFVVHCQAAVTKGGTLRFTNGAAFEIL